jgi:hypothetical protein
LNRKFLFLVSTSCTSIVSWPLLYVRLLSEQFLQTPVYWRLKCMLVFGCDLLRCSVGCTTPVLRVGMFASFFFLNQGIRGWNFWYQLDVVWGLEAWIWFWVYLWMDWQRCSIVIKNAGPN